MTALTQDRDTPRRDGAQFEHPVAAATRIFAGAIVANNASGYAVPGATSTTLTALGIAQAQIDNSAGLAGEQSVPVRRGLFRLANSAGADEVTRADINKPVYMVDDQTVAKSSGTNTRSVVGIARDLDAGGVWVEF